MVKSGKIQKKAFYDVSSSLTASKISLYAASPSELDGKIVKIDLTRSLRGKSLELNLRVKAEGEMLTSEPVKLELSGSYIRRAFRKGADYVEDSFYTDSKDTKVLMKSFMLTRNKVSRAVRRALRNSAREFLVAHIKSRTSKELFTEIMTNKIQKELSIKLKKIYPLALCEIRIFEVIKEERKLLESRGEMSAAKKEEAVMEKDVKKVKAEKKE